MSSTFQIPKGIVGNYFSIENSWIDDAFYHQMKDDDLPFIFIYDMQDGGTDYELGSGGPFSVYYKVKFYKFENKEDKPRALTKLFSQESLSKLTQKPLTMENMEKIKNEYK